MNLFVNFYYFFIENVTQYVLGVCIGCILYLIYEVFSLYKKIERINIDINKLQIKDIEFHRNIEFIINDSIKAKVETSLLPSSTGGRHGA